MGVEEIQICYNTIKGLIMQNNYNRTKYGKLHYIYSAQRASSRRRNMDMPSYTKTELYEWAISQDVFHDIFSKWEESNYNRMYAPSVDRKDDSLPYTMANIQLMSFMENNEKSHKDRKSGKLITSQNEMVKQFTKCGKFIKEYYSINQANRELSTNSPSKISEVCKGIRKTAYGFRWEYSTGGVTSV